MKIGVTSQNFRTITPHAGKTRRFLVYEAHSNEPIVEMDRLDLPKELAMHAFRDSTAAHPLDALDILIVGSCGDGFVQRMAKRGVTVIVSQETEPLAAVETVLQKVA